MKPIVGITMGDAAGIGPEIIVKTLSLKEIYEICRPVVIGDSKVIELAAKIVNVTLKGNPILKIEGAKFEFGTIDVVDLDNVDLEALKPGKIDSMAGKAAFQYIEKAVDLALRNEIHAIATAPINKEAMNKAGYNYAGHTELLAHLTRTKDYAMMLMVDSFRVVHVTTHLSLREACKMIKKERVLKVIRLTNKALYDMGIKKPRIAVAGLNPHGGEGGLFGFEEIKEIAPAVEEAKKEGINAVGPLPPDTVFVRARGDAFDAVIAMYHDQGHIPIKLLGLKWDENKGEWTSISGINVTIGLPIIRSSVDHGTAFGKAWKGTADPQSMIEAVKFAAQMAKTKILKQ
ncbi:MAG: 4-hydroxythreonine-4-phosphate dehydrogenase PdxA [Candidatus Bathyarchaeia archaeon]